jgi:hypothetical protein
VVNGCQQIFGALDFGNSKKLVQRQVYAIRLEEMAHTLEEIGNQVIGDYKVTSFDADGEPVFKIDPEIQERIANIRMKAAKIRGLMEKDKIENPNKYKVAPNIIFTDDIAALQLYREVEDAQFDDVIGNESQAG